MKIAAILLAAGTSTRFGPQNKLLAPLDGKPLVRHAAETLAAAGLSPIVAVTGPDAGDVAAALSGLPVCFVANADFADGMGSSIAVGVSMLGGDIDGVLVVPADMPRIGTDLIAALIEAFSARAGEAPVFPVLPDGRQSPPVLWPKAFFADLAGLDGPQGGKTILRRIGGVAVPTHDAAMLADIDTADDLARAGQRPG